ncbi:MAG: amidohydrolase family protein [Planctomycetaceae bacterium]
MRTAPGGRVAGLPWAVAPAIQVLLALLATTAAGADAEPRRPRAFVGGRVLPVTSAPIEAGTVVVADGKIVAVGPTGQTPVPADAEIVDTTGRVVIPGLVDTHSHVGGGRGGDSSAPVQPDVRILDSINVRDAGLRKCVAGGLTTLNIMPGSALLVGGQTVYVKLRRADTIEGLLYRDPAGRPLGGLKMANGTNPQRDAPFPGTRGKAAAMVRQKFLAAAEYRRKMAEPDETNRPARDLELESLAECLAGTRVVHHHTHRADDILTVLRLREEFGFRVVLHHVSEAWKVPGELARAGVPCSVIVVDSPGGKIEAMDMSLATGAILEEAGVPCAFHTDDPITDSRLFLRSAALAVRAGMSRERALEALTIVGARMLDLEARVGSLEPGKDADLDVLSGDPFSARTKVLSTWIEGERVFDRDDPADRLLAVGGYGAGRDQHAEWCCAGGDYR